MARVALFLLVAAASLAAFAAAASGSEAGAGGWSKPEILVKVGTATYHPAVVTGPTGTTVAVWDNVNPANETFALEAGIITVTGGIKKRPLGLMTGTFPTSSLAVGGDGTFAVAWAAPGPSKKTKSKTFGAVRVWRPGKSGFGATTLLSTGIVSNEQTLGDTPQVAVDDAGTVYVVWEGVYKKHTRIVEQQLGTSSNGFSAPRFLSPASDDAHAARIAAHGSGNAAVSWTSSSGAVWGSIIRAGHISAPTKLSPVTYAASPPSVAASSGKASAVWEQSAATGHVIESAVTTGSSFSSHHQVLTPTKETARFQAAALAANGFGLAAWEVSTSGGGWNVQARAMSAKGSAWGGAVSLTPAGSAVFGSAPSVAATTGRGFVAWMQRTANHELAGVKALVGSHWSPARTFPALGPPVVSAAANPTSHDRVLGALVWPSVAGLQIAVYVR
ncbi:MAG TPA: hypothetical protein VKR79_10610 [Gaiellaceae bacterium]|nr:hypothetical protein [Gaiellaceae bacterium]